MVDIVKTGNSRVFTIEDRASPGHTPVYQTLAKAGAVSWAQGDVTPIRIPDPNQYDQFIVVDEVSGAPGLPELPLTFRTRFEISDMLRITRKGCPIDIQVHVGACKTPSDFNGGFNKVLVLEGARITNYSTDDIGALDEGENAAVNETITFQGRDLYEVKPLTGAEVFGSEVVQEVVAVAICDQRSCGTCGRSSDGVQRWFSIQKAAGASPGLPAEIVGTNDNGATSVSTNVDTLAANEEPTDIACSGSYLVVLSSDSESLHYADIDDVIDGTESWAEVTSGFVAAKGPTRMFSLGAAFNWIVGLGGYIYFSSDLTTGVSVQDAGVQTAQNLADIHGIDELNIVAVGASNAVLVTSNGGTTWAALTGPDVGVALTSVWMRSAQEWFIGSADGKLWFTTNSGSSWTEKTFSGSGSGAVRDIVFATPTVGYMSHDTTTPRARIFRTIDGGRSWYALPEQAGLSLPLADRFNRLAASGDNPNFVLAGGLADNGTDGIVVKAA